MSSQFNARELCRLASQALDGDETELARLETLLATNADARRLYYLAVNLHAQLAWQFGESQPGEPPGETDREDAAVARSVVARGGVLQLWRRGVTYLSNPTHFSVFFAAVATVSLLLFFAQIRFGREANLRVDVGSPPAVVATLAAGVDCQWREPARVPALRAGMQTGETLELLSGLAEVQFPHAKLCLQGPVRFRIDSAAGGTLELGSLTARVAPQGSGFSIATPHLKVIDLGTEFGVRVGERGVTEVHVFAGQVETVLTRANHADFKRQTLFARQALRYDAGQAEPLERISANAAQFIQDLPSRPGRYELPITPDYVAAVLRSKPLAYWRFERLEGNKLRDEMRHCDLTAQGLLQLRGTAANRVAHFPPGVALVSSQPLVGLKHQPYSVELWCQPNPQRSGSLASLMSQDRSGQWAHLSYLSIQPEVNASGSTPVLRGLHRWPAGNYGGTNIYHRELLSGWQHIALVKTDTQLKLYVQGVEVAAAEDKTLASSDSFNIFVGGLGHATDRRYFSGAIDELAFHARALSAEEIAQRVRLVEAARGAPGDP